MRAGLAGAAVLQRYPSASVLRRLTVLVAFLALAAPAAAASPEVDARAYLVMDAASGEVLLARNAHDRLPVASITKLMTALLVTAHAKPNEVVAVDPDAVRVTGSTIRLRAGERITVRDLMAAALIQSANDSAVALGEFVGARVGEPFATLMNNTAESIGLPDTQFVRPDGLDVPGHYSSARDVTKLALVAMREPIIRRLVRQESATITGGRTLHTWNDLLGEFPGTFGVKTGHTTAAGWNQVAAARGNGVTIYATILGSPSRSGRNADLEELLAWGMSRYAVVPLAPPSRVYGRVPVTYGEEAVPVVAARPLRRAVRIGRPLVQRVILPSQVDLPVLRGDVLGELRFYERDRLVARTRLVAAEDRDAPSAVERVKWYAGRAASHIGGWFT
jgi:D-alanyl-D-alanine carboxypeptidase